MTNSDKKLLKYSYYDDNHNLIGVLNVEYICVKLGLNKIVLKEPDDSISINENNIITKKG